MSRRVHSILSQLRKIRRDKELSQEYVSKRAGYLRIQLCLYETGGREPRFQAVHDWAEALGYELVLRPKKVSA